MILVGVRVIPMLEQAPGASVILHGTEVLRIDVGSSDRREWIVGCELHCANAPSPLILPRNAVGVTRTVNPYELVQHLRVMADAIERNLR